MQKELLLVGDQRAYHCVQAVCRVHPKDSSGGHQHCRSCTQHGWRAHLKVLEVERKVQDVGVRQILSLQCTGRHPVILSF